MSLYFFRYCKSIALRSIDQSRYKCLVLVSSYHDALMRSLCIFVSSFWFFRNSLHINSLQLRTMRDCFSAVFYSFCE